MKNGSRCAEVAFGVNGAFEYFFWREVNCVYECIAYSIAFWRKLYAAFSGVLGRKSMVSEVMR